MLPRWIWLAPFCMTSPLQAQSDPTADSHENVELPACAPDSSALYDGAGWWRGDAGEVHFRVKAPDWSSTMSAYFTTYLPEIDDIVGPWAVSCDQDPIEDTRSCRVSREDLAVYVDSEANRFVWVGYDHFPGSEVAIRVDTGTPLRAEEHGWSATRAESVIRALRLGREARTRFIRWPYRSPVDGEVDLRGFSAAHSWATCVLQLPR